MTDPGLISTDWGPDFDDDPDEDALAFAQEEGLVWSEAEGAWLTPEDAAAEDQPDAEKVAHDVSGEARDEKGEWTPSAQDPRPGMRFLHARFRENLPGVPIREQPFEEYVVTSVRGNSVYYRAAKKSGGRPDFVADRAKFPDYVREILGSVAPDVPQVAGEAHGEQRP